MPNRSIRPIFLLLPAVSALWGCGGEHAPGPTESISVTELASPAGPGSAEPHLSRGANGRIILSWIEPVADGHALRYATLQGTAWSAPRTVTSGADWFVNWADFPSVEALTEELWAAHWLVKRSGGTYAYDVAIALSTDSGETWREPLTPHRDGTPTEHGFVSLFPWRDGVAAVWLDGRNMAPDPGASHDEHGAPDSGMTLRFARLSADGAITDEQLIDELTCDCCQTDVALAADGPVLAYRDRTAMEVRDIAVTRLADDSWTAPQFPGSDRWQIAGCPVNGPAVGAQGAQVAVAWFTAADDRPRVQLALSRDSGRTFSAPIEIDEGGVEGRVDVAVLEGGDVAVSWLAKSEAGSAELRLRIVSGSGQVPGPVSVVAATELSRAAGFPQMAAGPEGLVFAWTEPGQPTAIQTAAVDVRSGRSE